MAARLTGSADLYQDRGHRPINSVNFVTCHDGFTLADLVSYDDKHNEANGEDNRDGNDDNLSWNCGVEGPTDDPDVLALRGRQISNFATLLLLSRGVPMLVAGDEVGRTQQGNNNAYCQDNEIGWFDWSLVEANPDLLRFWTRLLAFRRAQRCPAAADVLHRATQQPRRAGPDLARHRTRHARLGRPGCPGAGLHPRRAGRRARPARDDEHVLGAAGVRRSRPCPVAAGRGRSTRPCPSPADIAEPGAEQAVDASTYLVSGAQHRRADVPTQPDATQFDQAPGGTVSNRWTSRSRTSSPATSSATTRDTDVVELNTSDGRPYAVSSPRTPSRRCCATSARRTSTPPPSCAG